MSQKWEKKVLNLYVLWNNISKCEKCRIEVDDDGGEMVLVNVLRVMKMGDMVTVVVEVMKIMRMREIM